MLEDVGSAAALALVASICLLFYYSKSDSATSTKFCLVVLPPAKFTHCTHNIIYFKIANNWIHT